MSVLKPPAGQHGAPEQGHTDADPSARKAPLDRWTHHYPLS